MWDGLTSTAPVSTPTTVTPTPQPVEETGPIRFKNAKAKNSLLQVFDETKPVEPVQKPVEEGAAPIKFKGKLKVEYKETSAERKQREAEEEARKQSSGIIFSGPPKTGEIKPVLEKKPAPAPAPVAVADVKGLDARSSGFGAAKPEAKPLGRGTLPTNKGSHEVSVA